MTIPIEMPMIDQFVCTNEDCGMHDYPTVMWNLHWSAFDKTWRCEECGNIVEMTDPRQPEWWSVSLSSYDTADLDDEQERWLRDDSTIRCFQKGDWPQVLLYVERLTNLNEYTMLDGWDRVLVLAEQIPEEVQKGDVDGTIVGMDYAAELLI